MRSPATALALTLVLVGCEDPTAIQPTVAVSLELDRTVVEREDSIAIEVAVANAGGESIAISGGDCPEAFEVIDPGGQRVAPNVKVCSLRAVVELVDPGEVLMFNRVWHVEDTMNSAHLPSGTYELRGRIIVDGHVVHSTPVEIVVE